MSAVPPNVLYLHSHDTGRLVQPYGLPVPTPNLQRLADQGMLFRRAFATAATCSGSRSSLLTGQYPHRNGMMGLAHRGWRLREPERHIVHALRMAGYHSELVGEQHVSADPRDLGYDRVHDPGGTEVARVAPLAGELLRGGLPEPFFLSVGFFETHRAFFAPRSVRDALDSAPPANLPDLPAVRRDMAAFKASARTLDDGIGAVLGALQEARLDERTLVVCTTDHGIPFPGAKATLFDRGLGVMLIVRGPGGFHGGRVSDALVSHLDVYPTLCDLAGVEHPPGLDGRSLLALAAGEEAAIRDALFAELTWHAAYEPQRAIRTDRFKLIRRWEPREAPVLVNCDDGPTKDALVELGWHGWGTDVLALHDLVFDPDEMRNLAADPGWAPLARELEERLATWMEATEDPLLDGPVPLPPGAWAHGPEQRSASEPPTLRGELPEPA